jgi:hypothetical protein
MKCLSTLLRTSLSGGKELIAKFVIVYDWDYWRTFAPFVSAHLLASGIQVARGAG